MTTPLQSPEYAALVAAKEARDAAYAHKEQCEKAFLARALENVYVEEIDSERWAWVEASENVTIAQSTLDTAQAAFDAAYPAPADVVEAVDALRSGHEAVANLQAQFEASLTDEQREIKALIALGEQNNTERLAHAKALIEAAQVSPSKAFVVRSSTKMVTDNMEAIEEAVFGNDLPSELVTVDQKALQKYMSEHPARAEAYRVKFEQSVSVAFYAAKL